MLLRDVGKATPLVLVCVGMCLGILLFVRDLPFILFCLVFALFLLGKRAFLPLAIGVVLGFASMAVSPAAVEVPEGDYRVQGRVAESGFVKGTFCIVLDRVFINGKESPGRMLLRVYEGVREPGRGRTLEGIARLKPWLERGNLGEFDYRAYLLAQGITASGYIKDMCGVSLTGESKGPTLRSRVSALLAKNARPEAEILNAALTGDRSGLVDSLQDSFSALGISHLIAISGLNMTVVFLLGYSASFLVMRLLLPVSLRLDTPLAAQIAGLACVLCYTAFVGYSPPAARAAIMVCTAVVFLLMARRPDLIESLAFSGILILLRLPWSLYSPSFLLSFGAVLGITGTLGRLRGKPGWLLVPAVPLVSAAFTAPLAVHLFGFVSPVGIAANMVFVPWFSFVVMPLGLAGLLALPLSPWLSSRLLSLAFDGTGIMLGASEVFGSLDPVPSPGVFWVMACYAGLVAAFFGKPSAWRNAFLAACVLIIVAFPAGNRVAQAHRGLAFDFINVGQADSILITRGLKAVLIDAGSPATGSDAGRFVVAPHLLRRGVAKLDLVIMTHAHPDHVGGMPYLLSRFPVDRVWTCGMEDPSPDFQTALRIAQKKSIPVQCPHRGDSRTIGGIEVRVLSPPAGAGAAASDSNLNSIVVRAGDDGMRGLFMADAWGLGEIRLCRLHEEISADVLKVAHHGSKGSCLNMFLERVRPALAVIPVGRRNLYRLPHGDALQRLSANGVPVYRTDRDGSVTVFREGGHICVKSGLSPADRKMYGASKRTE